MIKIKPKTFLYVAWIFAIVSVLGSLYFSEIAHFPPCILCWYQRIFMYPLAILIPVGILKKDKNLPYYVLPLTIIGGLIAIYHNLLYWNIIPEAYTPCAAGISCTTRFIEWFGFVTIPFLSFCSFLVIAICMKLYLKSTKKKNGRF
ncbi:disulfide bond formation protein B [Candidatus Woesebacteria bacterium]|nr:disulfide bond formation protein B [Candidatus Woesebacteria bacterium]QQG47228.1 MAG: disulfide bond formation protein B [Candidatus Woesebacteria bacterium]